MRPGFGNQPMPTHAKRMMADPEWMMKWIWFKRCGKPPIAFDEFTPSELAAFLIGIEAEMENAPTLQGGGRWGPPRKIEIPKDPTEPVKTGDNLVDKWEREIAAGRMPDLSEGLSP